MLPGNDCRITASEGGVVSMSITSGSEDGSQIMSSQPGDAVVGKAVGALPGGGEGGSMHIGVGDSLQEDGSQIMSSQPGDAVVGKAVGALPGGGARAGVGKEQEGERESEGKAKGEMGFVGRLGMREGRIGGPQAWGAKDLGAEAAGSETLLVHRGRKPACPAAGRRMGRAG